ncbi:MAG: hypothetical protein KJO63_09085, partial [Maribacter sp.]|nr:hypothetical protein [Maribacter sp.]
MKTYKSLVLIIFVLLSTYAYDQQEAMAFGTETSLTQLISNSEERSINWVNVNTDPDTWYTE